jgi:hypothetical protein
MFWTEGAGVVSHDEESAIVAPLQSSSATPRKGRGGSAAVFRFAFSRFLQA